MCHKYMQIMRQNASCITGDCGCSLVEGLQEAYRDTLRARVGLRRAPERGGRERAATKAVCRGGPSPDMGLAAMPTLFSGMGGVPTSGATGSMPYGLVATPARDPVQPSTLT